MKRYVSAKEGAEVKGQFDEGKSPVCLWQQLTGCSLKAPTQASVGTAKV